MIRRFIIVLISSCVAVLFVAAYASAQDSSPMTNEHLMRVKDNCQSAQRTLSQLYISDRLLRVNRGQLYDLISTKLMARMNSRIALNRLDGSQLVGATANFDKAFNIFRTRYKSYEDQLSAVIHMNCRDEPAKFYYTLKKTRELRASVNDSAMSLNSHIGKYTSEFETFRTKFKQTKHGGGA